MPRGIVAVGYFTQRRSDAHDYRPDIEVEVAEAVSQHLPAFDLTRLPRQSFPAPVLHGRAINLGQAPQPAPNTALRPSLEINVPAVTGQHHRCRAQRLLLLRFAPREFGN